MSSTKVLTAKMNFHFSLKTLEITAIALWSQIKIYFENNYCVLIIFMCPLVIHQSFSQRHFQCYISYIYICNLHMLRKGELVIDLVGNSFCNQLSYTDFMLNFMFKFHNNFFVNNCGTFIFVKKQKTKHLYDELFYLQMNLLPLKAGIVYSQISAG